MEAFNLDVIIEILSRSSLPTLSKCRLLSKECNTLSYQSLFRDLHSQRNKIVSGFFIQFTKYSEFVSTDDQPPLSLDFLPSRVQIQASTTTGILLCVNITPRIPEYYVCKPTTKQYRKLPNPKTRYFTEVTGMVLVKSNPLCYKIIRISQPKDCRYGYSDYCKYRTEIFDSETWSWKRVNDLSLPRSTFLIRKLPISAGGSLYWPTTDDKTIVAYHKEDECCTTFCLPEKIHEESLDIKYVGYEGRLAVVRDRGESVELWMMNNKFGEKDWKMRLLMSCEDVKKEDDHASFRGYYRSDVALFHGFCKLILYDMNNEKKNINVFKTIDRFYQRDDLFQFQSDYELVSFDSRKKT